jgi:hypothetical protein
MLKKKKEKFWDKTSRKCETLNKGQPKNDQHRAQRTGEAEETRVKGTGNIFNKL